MAVTLVNEGWPHPHARGAARGGGRGRSVRFDTPRFGERIRTRALDLERPAADLLRCLAGAFAVRPRDNPDLPRSLLCARSIGARLQRMGFVPTERTPAAVPGPTAGLRCNYYDNLVVLYRTRLPAVLFEAG